MIAAPRAAADPALWAAFQHALRRADGESHLLRDSGRYPLTGRGDINTYAVFAELMRSAARWATGELGVIVPTGIATDDTTKCFFGDLVARRALVSLYSFENEEKVFPSVHNEFKFCLLDDVRAWPSRCRSCDFVFFARQVGWLAATRSATSRSSSEDFAAAQPEHADLPDVPQSHRDAEIAKAIYRRVPVLVRDGDPNGQPLGDVVSADVRHGRTTRGSFSMSPARTELPSTRRRCSTSSTIGTAPTTAKPKHRRTRGSSANDADKTRLTRLRERVLD